MRTRPGSHAQVVQRAQHIRVLVREEKGMTRRSPSHSCQASAFEVVDEDKKVVEATIASSLHVFI